MNDFYDLILPREIRFRAGVAQDLPALLPVNTENILFIAGNHAVKSGDAAGIVSILEQAGKKVILLSGVPPEPAPAEVDKLIRAGRDNQCDAVVALGGGSVIDAAKAAAALIPADGWCQEYFTGAKKITKKGLFFAASSPLEPKFNSFKASSSAVQAYGTISFHNSATSSTV